MLNILQMNENDLLNLGSMAVEQLMSNEEILHIFSALGGLWLYNYEAAKEGKPGLHAELKSKRHSNGFLNSKVVLKHENIRWILAQQLVMKWKLLSRAVPTWVAGIPDGATKLGEDVAKILGAKVAEMKKVDGKIKMVQKIAPHDSLLLVEDFCTRATGFIEAVRDILLTSPDVDILLYELVIMNRGGLKDIQIEGVGTFDIIPSAEHRIDDWTSEDCPLCGFGSETIKPKATVDSWDLIMNSQKAIPA